ncbi:tryptophan 2,3-dioxygenase family protein [Aliiglaciecola sp. CAU 1673]|uniref:tryptophan 2,3-dioxygenase family protein n=1 Tax=Aliiglaciecola sp. CAU 1673 TaxID=3032595 RepID=UPI0023DA2743|nr:tryptophan 2,3-dioxygenase family protein [Aliiglaciecola sp. CAU 1673]MDF2179570.1 tryptophan 2,3-dioxygenase family protein [Aliiglaciecola sp. CAU 1673]
MKKNIEPVYYGEYLQLDKLLSAQAPHSTKYGETAHDETLFIIVHQVYELWFKQILHELSTVLSVFAEEQVKDQQLTTVVHRLKRVISIQELLNDQIAVMETMTPQDFLAFRDYLVPASGFQSIQFKMLEIGLGLKHQFRIDFDKQSFYMRLNEADRNFLQDLENKPSLFELVDKWLARMPLLEFGDFKFWSVYEAATNKMLDNDAQIISDNPTLTEKDKELELKELSATRQLFAALLDEKEYLKWQEQGQFRLSQKALLSALFIHQYREEPLFNLPYQFITCLTEIDEKLTIWRYRHAMMVQRMLGSKIGTGGSSGHDYLKRTTESNRIFKDFFSMATFLLPKTALPDLPEAVRRQLGFYLTL